MSLLRSVYKVFRSIVMTMIVLMAVIYLGLYVLLSIPSVQDKIRDRVSAELSVLTGGGIRIGSLNVAPFSEVSLVDVALYSPEGERCASIRRLAAGIDLWTLIADRRIVLNYAEIIGLDAKIVQPTAQSPLNIQFLIDALSSKDKNKPAASFDIKIRNVVVRDSKSSFSRPWMIDETGVRQTLADIDVRKLRMDLSIPVLSNDLYSFDVRNIQFEATPGVNVRSLSGFISYAKQSEDGVSDRLEVRNLRLELPGTSLSFGDLRLRLDSISDINAQVEGHVTPSDFQALVPALQSFGNPWSLALDASLEGKRIGLSELRLEDEESESYISIKGELGNFGRLDSLDITLDRLNAVVSSRLLAETVGLIPTISSNVRHGILTAGRFSLDLEGNVRGGEKGMAVGRIATDAGSLGFDASVSALHSKKPILSITADAEDLDLGKWLSTDKAGRCSFHLDADVEGTDRNAEGRIHLTSDECIVVGNRITSFDINLSKMKETIDLALDASSDEMSVTADGGLTLAGSATKIDVDMSLSGFKPSVVGLKGQQKISEISGRLRIGASGDRLDNITGILELADISLRREDGRLLSLSKLSVTVDSIAGESAPIGGMMERSVRIGCDWLDGYIEGRIDPNTIATDLKEMAGTALPTLMSTQAWLKEGNGLNNDFTFDLNFKGTSAPYLFFDLPVRPLTDIPVRGYIDGPRGKASVTITTPHLQQGKNKLISNVAVNADLDASLGMAKINAGLIFPAKKGDAELAAQICAANDNVDVNIDINPTLDSSVKGNLAFGVGFSRIPDPFKPKGEVAVDVQIHPSTILVNEMGWQIADGSIDYSGNRVAIRNFLVSHDAQYVRIDGVASETDDDQIKVRLNDIDLEYIFNILNINYVSFGGMATGEIVGSRLLTNMPRAKTNNLRVKGLSYNGAVLGDGDLASDYDSRQQMVGIYAVIRDPLTRHRRVSVDGGIWVTRDSLSFGFDADKVNVGIMKPFVSAFCSDLYGEASGKCKLYGTFSDIDLVGDLKADTLSMKLDFTNTWYHAGNDSVFLHKGVIDIPPLTLYDDEGHTAEFSGWLRHTYFHDPVFNFRLRDAQSLLCYDTNAQINPLWYGTIYGTGHAQINGHPGLIDIDMNMATEEGSKFYYIISDAEDIAQYSFLTFTDRRKEQMKEAAVDTVPEYLKRFRKQAESTDTGSSNVILSLKGTVTNDALVTLVMDPKAGDNITARGQGALQMDYNLASNDLRMIGTYVLDEGNYNFTLQDIIIKNFNIRKGSLIKFNGDPMNATLDITATYRVNTNLTDLDESFANDKELNRTNVPVDAVLLVDGPMTNPDITFDIELPSLTSDVERKVKSIVSTNDMMSRQIIYLLAMNRFYTPEYTNGQGNGSEWSSLASSTISSQLSNILSQMTDKLDVAPSFRSDKGDFTDMEFDLALSSRLLNNRLLINGNFGYRDKNTSNTQFIGDFDIEYLLSKNGNLRLKAYNHFNDQNYYLRSALTTQGVGVVFRKDFDRLFRRRKTDLKEKSVEDGADLEKQEDGVNEKMPEGVSETGNKEITL